METESRLNYAAGAVIVSVTSADPAWPASNLLRADEPLAVWRSVGLAQQQIVLNFGAALPVGLTGLSNVNFESGTIEIASNVGITADVLSMAVTPRACKTGRLQCGTLWQPTHSPVPSRQYMRITIPAQTPVDGAPYYFCGGVWAGVATPFPVSLSPHPKFEVVEPRSVVPGVGDGAPSVLDVGEPYIRVTCDRFGEVGLNEGVDDDFGAWATFDTRLRRAGAVAVFFDYGNPAHYWVMRRASRPQWSYTYPFVRDALTLEEVILPMIQP